MNLVISGQCNANLRNLIVALSKPRNVVDLHARATRFEAVDDSTSTRTAVSALCETAKVDHAYLSMNKTFPSFKLLVMDMDSTLITIECIDELADLAGKKAEVAFITEIAMAGKLDFAESLRRRVAMLGGTSTDILKRVYDERLHLTSGALQLLQACRELQIYTVLLSGGFTYFTDRLQEELKLDESFANVLLDSNGRLTGQVMEPIFDAEAKLHALENVMASTRTDIDNVMAVGDGANDIPMIAKAKHSISYRGKPSLMEHASVNIKFGNLSSILDFYPVN